MKADLQSDEFPELIFGLVAPIGVNLEPVIHALNEVLQNVGYNAENLRVTKLMQEIPLGLKEETLGAIASYENRIAHANEICRQLGPDALARMSISAIRSLRLSHWKQEKIDLEVDDERLAERPIPSQTYIIRQLKRPEEIQLLRKVYGRQFIAVSIYDSEEHRIENLKTAERNSLKGLCDDAEIHTRAYRLVSRDSKESGQTFGQNVRDAFPLGDVFIDGRSRATSEDTIRRFVNLLFGNNQITPTRDEYGMYLAKSASLRSSDLSRQVGAAIFRDSGEVAALGCNEVPKSGGGTYWPSDPVDERDFRKGVDPNDEQKTEILVDVVDRLVKGKFLATELMDLGDPIKVAQRLLEDETDFGIKESRLMDLLEFGRIIHAEMSAISDAARKGIAVKSCTLYCTTFPCHICAKHIVATGISRVVYLEPYPKSYATRLHRDSITLDPKDTQSKVCFEPFIGISPFRYRDLFEKGKRKYLGKAEEWPQGRKRPQIDVYFPSYFRAEALVVDQFRKQVELKLPTLPQQNGGKYAGGGS